VLAGAGVRQGEVPGTWTLHNLLRTIEDMVGAGHSGSAEVAGEFDLTPNAVANDAIFDVTASIRLWQADPTANHGWLLRGAGVEDWVWFTSEPSDLELRPQLSVVYAVPEPAGWTLAASLCIALIARRNQLTKRSA